MGQKKISNLHIVTDIKHLDKNAKMVNSFSDNFWDSDWNGTNGYNALVTRLKDGKKLYDAYAGFVRNRAKIEDEYGKKLINLAQFSGALEETGTLRQAWDSIRKETE